MNIKSRYKRIKRLATTEPIEALVEAVDFMSIDGVQEFETKVQGSNIDEGAAADARGLVYLEFLYFFSHYACRIAYASFTEHGFAQFISLLRKQVTYLAQERLRMFHNEVDYKKFPLKVISDKIANTDDYYGHHSFSGKKPQDQDNVFTFLRDNISDIFGEQGHYHYEVMNDAAITRVWVRNQQIIEYIPDLVTSIMIDNVMKNI